MIVDNNFNKWNINKLPRTKGAQGTTGSSGVVTLNAGNREGTGYPELEAHYLWGQFFNGKQDVNGDITTDGDVNFYGNLNFLGEYNQDDDLHGNLNIGNVNADNGHFKKMNADILKAAEAYINNLTVTGSAHFFELIIDKIRSVGGAIMLTPGDGFELWGYNVQTSEQINLWWVKTDDRNGKYNKWVVGDQALCRSFDSAQVGTSSNVDNKYWWAKVVAVDTVGKWCIKLHTYDYNPDEVMVLPIGEDNAYYTNTHSYLRTTDFMPSDKYVYVYIESETVGGVPIYHRDRWITNEEYFNLSASDKAKYEYSQIYVHVNDDGSTVEISEYQYENRDISQTDILVYDKNTPNNGKVLRSFCKADCKFCYNITISIASGNYATGSTFRVEEGSPAHYAYVFQEGDNIVMLGNQTDENRQNAIYLNAGGQGDSLDTDLRPPFFAQYKGINDFDLKSHRLTWFSGGSTTQGVFANEIKGNLKIMSSDPNVDGENVQDYVNSQLIVTEDHITAEVLNEVNGELNRTGIDIEDGTITLDALKTIITGVLQLNEGETGLVLYDNNGNPVISIQNTPVGNITDIKHPLNINQVIELQSQSNTATFHLEHPWMVKSGETYELDNLIAGCMVENSGANISSINITITLKRSDNDSTISTIVPTRTISGVSGQAYVVVGNDFTFTPLYTGNVYFDVAMTITFGQNYSSGNVLYGYINSKITQPIDKIVKLGNDGLQVVNGSNKYCILGNSNYTLRQGNSTLSIGDDSMRRTIGSSTGDIGSIVKVKICTPTSQNYQYTQDDGLVIFNGSWNGDPVYYLPNSAATNLCDGRIIYFKNLTDRTLKFKTPNEDNILINANSNTPTTEITVGSHSCMMICGGGYWIYYFMG